MLVTMAVRDKAVIMLHNFLKKKMNMKRDDKTTQFFNKKIKQGFIVDYMGFGWKKFKIKIAVVGDFSYIKVYSDVLKPSTWIQIQNCALSMTKDKKKEGWWKFTIYNKRTKEIQMWHINDFVTQQYSRWTK